jgi:16S rRNA (guanine527-N7)-methyltransferase
MKAEELLKSGLDELGIPCNKEQAASLLLLLSELKKWNRTYNLTSITDEKGMIIKHLFDSLLYLKVIPNKALRIADLGSGAGFPGIPIKIIRPDLDMTLVESSRKKASFLKHIIRLLGLTGISVIQVRAEEAGEALQKSFDVAVSRATFSIKDFIKTACPYIKDDGILVISKGPKLSEELEGLASAEEVVKEIREIELPHGGLSRNLVLLSCRKE